MPCVNGTNTSKNGSPQSLDETYQQTAEEYLPKGAKIRLGRYAVMLEDLRALAKDDRDVVRRYRDKTVFGGEKPEDEPMGDLIIADNITMGSDRAQPSKSMGTLGKVALAAALLGGGAGLGALLAGALDRPATADTDTQYELEFPEVSE